jgi:3-oxoadipate enol-lactonase
MPFLRIKSFNVFYRKLGSQTQLPPMVFVHGIWANHLTWINQIRFFSKLTEIYILDLLGHGKSDKPKEGISIDLLSEIVKGIIEKLEIRKPVVIGHSLGGFITQNIALKYPELISKIVLVCTGVDLELFGIKIEIPKYILVFLKNLLSLGIWNLLYKVLPNLSSPKEIKGYKGKNFEASMAATCSGKSMLSIIYYVVQFDISEKVSSIQTPLLFISGTKDAFYNQRKVYQKLSNAEVKIKPGGEHSLQLANGELNNWILEFIKK